MAGLIGAFGGDAKAKQAVLADLANPPEGENIWAAFAENRSEIEAYCEAHGFEPAFIYLTRALVGYTLDEKATGFLHDVLSALPLSADTGTLVSNWFVWLWEGRKSGALRDSLAGSGALAPAEALIAMHRRGPGERPSRQEWRQARNSVFAVPDLTPTQQGAAGIASASGWDIVTTPGAVADVVQLCFGVSQVLVDERYGWGEKAEAMRDAIEAAMKRLQSVALAELGAAPSDRSDEAVMRPYMEKFQAIMAAQRTDAENEVFAQMEERGKAIGEAADIVRQDLRQGLLATIQSVSSEALVST